MFLNRQPHFNKRIFWDVDFEHLDYQKQAAFIVERVFERGDIPDIRNCRRFYGDDTIRKILTNVKWLPLTTIYLACAILDNQLTDYRCYNTAQYTKGHWSY